jgi:lipoyl(octanoyl) transferase
MRVLPSSCFVTVCVGSTLDNLRSMPPPFELVRTERGGEVTYHGPGQLVLYPVLDLRAYQQDVHWYMRSLEEVALRTVRSFGLPARRVPGLTGVWVEDAKVCAIGVKLSRWVTMHGLALNVDVNLDHFGHIVPCGIADR